MYRGSRIIGPEDVRVHATPADASEGVSLVSLGTTVLRGRWTILRAALLGSVLAAALVMPQPKLYVASGSFVPRGGEGARPDLASIAGQFGFSLGSGSAQAFSPDFYASLLRSRVVLQHVADDTLVVPELGGRRVALAELMGVNDASQERRRTKVVEQLKSAVSVSVVRATGVAELSVATKWPSVSLAVANGLLAGINAYNQSTRQSQAEEERRFIEGRLSLAEADLRSAEDRLAAFLASNRESGSSPQLTFQRNRLERAVALRQQLYTSLMQSYEELRIREVRDAPAITILETPSLPSDPRSQHRFTKILLGAVLGGSLGVVVVLTSAAIRRRLKQGDTAAEEFQSALHDLKLSRPRLSAGRKAGAT